MDFALHRHRFPVTLEKWYLDALFEDGSVLLVYLARLSLFGGAAMGRVTADLWRPEGGGARGSARADDVRGSLDCLCFGPARIEGDRLQFVTPGLSGELVYRPRQPPCTLREPFLARGDRALHWSVEIPDADVEGVLRWPGGALDVRARGYRDRVWFDLLPWRFPILTLRWGRGVAGDHAATWVRAETVDGGIDLGWIDGRPCEGSPAGVELGHSRTLVDADVLALEGLGLGVLGRLLGRVSGHPHETKMTCPCAIDGEPGVAVHEVVTWHA